MMRSYQRIFLIVIDSLGISGAPDAACFHDEGADTLGHIAQRHVPLHIPNLCRLGIANLRCLAAAADGAGASWLLCQAAGSERGQGYDERALGDDGPACAHALPHLYRYRVPARAHRRAQQVLR